MFALVAHKNDISQEKIGGNFLDHYSSEIVALFDKEKDAKEYIKRAKLKNPRFGRVFEDDRVYKKGSLLHNAYDASVVPYEISQYPLNPKINF
jgi:hypothetical protein